MTCRAVAGMMPSLLHPCVGGSLRMAPHAKQMLEICCQYHKKKAKGWLYDEVIYPAARLKCVLEQLCGMPQYSSSSTSK